MAFSKYVFVSESSVDVHPQTRGFCVESGDVFVFNHRIGTAHCAGDQIRSVNNSRKDHPESIVMLSRNILQMANWRWADRHVHWAFRRGSRSLPLVLKPKLNHKRFADYQWFQIQSADVYPWTFVKSQGVNGCAT